MAKFPCIHLEFINARSDPTSDMFQLLVTVTVLLLACLSWVNPDSCSERRFKQARFGK